MLKNCFFVSLAVLGLSCGIWDLHYVMWDLSLWWLRLLFAVSGLSRSEACGILVPWPGVDWTCICCIARWILNHWTMREVSQIYFSDGMWFKLGGECSNTPRFWLSFVILPLFLCVLVCDIFFFNLKIFVQIGSLYQDISVTSSEKTSLIIHAMPLSFMSSFRHLCLCSTYPCGNCTFVYLYFACLHVAVHGCLGSISVQCLV